MQHEKILTIEILKKLQGRDNKVKEYINNLERNHAEDKSEVKNVLALERHNPNSFVEYVASFNMESKILTRDF